MNKETILYQIATTSGNLNISGWEMSEQDDILRLAKVHRVIDPVLKSAPSISLNGDNWIEKSRKETLILKHIMELLRTLINEHVIFAVIKGYVMKDYYPHDVPRQSKDCDILIKDISNYWRAVLIAQTQGFNFEHIAVFAASEQGPCGLQKMKKNLPDEGLEVRIEFNIGGFILSESNVLDDPDIWKETTFTNIEGTLIPRLSDNINFIILVAETGGNYHLRIRDIVDYKYILEKAQIDWEYVQKKMQVWKLEHDFASLINTKKKLETSRLNTKSPSVYQTVVWRLKRELHHIIPLFFSKGNPWKKTLVHMYFLIGNFFMKKNIFLRFVRVMEKLISPSRMYRHGTFVHFIPISDRGLVMSYSWVDFRKLSFVEHPLGVSLVSCFCILNTSDESTIEGYLNEYDYKVKMNE